MTDPNTRSVDLFRLSRGRYEAVNPRGGKLVFGSDGAEFTPVELLLAAIAGCGAIDVDFITSKRSEPSRFDLKASGVKVRDEAGNHLTDLSVGFHVAFPEGDAGDAARATLNRAVAASHDRLCTVSRTVELGSAVTVRVHREGD